MRVQQAESTSVDLRVSVERSIWRIDDALWDSVNASSGLYWTHRFLTCVEDSVVENADYWYLLFYRGDELVATAVLSSFVVSLDLLLPRYVQRFCDAVRRVFPSFLKPRMLFCGLPVSIGKHTLGLSGKVPTEAVLAELHSQMIQIARANGIGYVCFKEFAGDDLRATEPLGNHGYFRAPSIPRVRLDLRWQSYGAYLKSMRHGYRRIVRQSLMRLGIVDAARLVQPEGSAEHTLPRLVIRHLTAETAALTHRLYLEVMQRATAKLEILNAAFFARLADAMIDDLVLLCLEDRDGIQGAALLGRNGPVLNFLFVGFDYESRDEYHTYFNLLNGIIWYGIEERFERIDLGQTTYAIKQRLGGETEPVYFYFRALSPTVHALLRFLKPILFPVTQLRPRRVFRGSPAD